MFYVFVVLCLFGSGLAANCSSKPYTPPLTICCPNVTTLKDFDVNKYIGFWYEQRTYRPNNYSPDKCATMEYKLDENNNLMLSYKGISLVGRISSGNATTRIENSAEPAKLKAKHFSDPSHESDYWILGTDYSSYALTYGCAGLKGYCELYATILTREVDPSESVINAALEIAKKNSIDVSRFRPTQPFFCKKEFVDLL